MKLEKKKNIKDIKTDVDEKKVIDSNKSQKSKLIKTEQKIKKLLINPRLLRKQRQLIKQKKK